MVEHIPTANSNNRNICRRICIAVGLGLSKMHQIVTLLAMTPNKVQV